MHPSGFKKTTVEMILLWIVPCVATLISILYWIGERQPAYLGYLWVVPAVFAACAVGIAAGPLKLWQWHPLLLPQLVFIQRPLVYAAYFNTLGLCSVSLPASRLQSLFYSGR